MSQLQKSSVATDSPSGYGWFRPGWQRTWTVSQHHLDHKDAASYRKFNDWMISVEKVLGSLKDALLKTNAENKGRRFERAGQEMEALALLDETSALVKALCLDTG